MSIGVCIFIILGCLLIQAFFAASEMALVSANRLRIRHLADSGSKQAKTIQMLLENPEKFLSTTLVGNNVFLVLGAAVASYLTYRIMGPGHPAEVPLVATVVMLPLVLIFAEIVPKTLVQPRATQMSVLLSVPLCFSYYMLYPLIQVVSWLASLVMKLGGGPCEKNKMFSSVEDILLLMKEGQRQGALTEDERKMISRVFDFGETEVGDIMVPLIDVALAGEDSRVRDIWKIIRETGYTRIPIYRERVDKIIGTVQVSDLVVFTSGWILARYEERFLMGVA